MTFKLRANSRLATAVGPERAEFLRFGLDSIVRILPHVETTAWKVTPGNSKTRATFRTAEKRELKLSLEVPTPEGAWCVEGTMQRRRVAKGVGAIARTIDVHERGLCDQALKLVARSLAAVTDDGVAALRSLHATFDERVIARHVEAAHAVEIDIAAWFAALRKLAEQTYENRALAFGCVVDTSDVSQPSVGYAFPADFLDRKRYRALSDGYRTAYRVSRNGAVIGFCDLRADVPPGKNYYPDWCEDIARQTNERNFAICLTRQGDILVLDRGRLAFTYRLGHWQYWNHAHIVDLVRNAARVQHVPPERLYGVVRAIYRAALDVSFRRSGGLFVLLRARKHLRAVVRRGDAIEDATRDGLAKAFDRSIPGSQLESLSRAVLVELASLDGAIVVANTGMLLAYGAVLEPQRKGKILQAEGSRTKAAIGASNYGLAVKVSSDGDITVYAGGSELIRA